MSSAERSSIQNAIWLCSVCATLVDRDVEAYTPERLLTWKGEAERLAASELNTRPPAHGDASAQLVAALSGQSPRFLPAVIGNAHEASAKALERLDSRFQVESSYQNKTTTFTLYARENVQFKLFVPLERALEWQAKVRSALDDGLGFEIDATGVKAQGSPLLEQVFDGDAIQQPTITVSPKATPVRAKLAAIDRAGTTRQAFDDVEGLLFMGMTSLTFKGELWGGLAQLTMRLQHPEKPLEGRFSLNFDFGHWVNLDIRGLPYLPSMVEFFRHAGAGELLDVTVFERGQQRLGMHANFEELGREAGSQLAFLGYLTRASEVAKILNVVVRLPKQISVSKKDVEDLSGFYDVVTAPSRIGRERLSTNPSFTLTATDKGENIQLLREQRQPSIIAFKQTIPGELMIFEQTIPLPLVNLVFNNVFCHVLDERQLFSAGDTVHVEIEPADGFWMSYELAHENDGDS